MRAFRLSTAARILGIASTLLASSCGKDRHADQVQSLQSALTPDPFQYTFKITSITAGQHSTGERDTFSLGTPGAEFFECGGGNSLDGIAFCNVGQVFRIPQDLPQFGATAAFNATKKGTFVPGQQVLFLLYQTPSALFGEQPIAFNLIFDFSTGAKVVTAVQGNTSGGHISQLTNTCLTNNLGWKICWEVTFPCDPPATSLVCSTTPSSSSCPPAAGHAACAGGLPGPCIADPVPGGAVCNAAFPYDLTPNLAPGQTDVTDNNGILLNPRWGWQMGTATPPLCCITSQPTTRNSGCDATNTIAQLTHDIFEPSSDFPWHTNWVDATYTGPLRFDVHEPPIKDDDYNISIVPPLVGDTFPAGMTPDNGTLNGVPHFIQTEFDAGETIDRFDGAAIPWWLDFHSSVDASKALASNRIDGHDGVITGRMGTDDFHGRRSELHPVHFFAVRQSLVPNPNDDAWSFFFRNWGNEGFCGTGQEKLNVVTASLQVPRPTSAQGVGPGATFTIGPATKVGGNTSAALDHTVFVSQAANGDAVLTVQLDPPDSESWVAGEVHLVWSPLGTGTAPAPPPPLLAAGAVENDDGILFDFLTPAQQTLASAIFKGMVPAPSMQLRSFSVVKAVTPPTRPAAPPTVSSGPADPRTVIKEAAKITAACAATGGNIPGGYCTNSTFAGAGVCMHASGTLSIDDRVTLTNPNGSLGSIANSGAGQTNVGADAKVGAIASVGPVLLRSRATTGAVTTAATVTTQDGVIHGAVLEHQALALPTAGLVVTFPVVQNPPAINLNPGDQTSLAPGTYGAVSIKSGATLSLSAGTYFVDSLTLEPQSKASLDSKAAAVVIYVKNGFTMRGAFVEKTGGQPNVIVGVLGSQGAVLGAPFHGTVIAPSGIIELDTVGSPGFSGAFVRAKHHRSSGYEGRVHAFVDLIRPTGRAFTRCDHDINHRRRRLLGRARGAGGGRPRRAYNVRRGG